MNDIVFIFAQLNQGHQSPAIAVGLTDLSCEILFDLKAGDALPMNAGCCPADLEPIDKARLLHLFECARDHFEAQGVKALESQAEHRLSNAAFNLQQATEAERARRHLYQSVGDVVGARFVRSAWGTSHWPEYKRRYEWRRAPWDRPAPYEQEGGAVLAVFGSG